MKIQARAVIRVTLTPEPCYTLRFSLAGNPLSTVQITLPIKARVATRQEASTAAIREMNAITDGELAVMLAAQSRPRN